jgi:hypothetical protein
MCNLKSFLRDVGKNEKASLVRRLLRGDEWTRTTDSRIFSPMLYQLSYITVETRHKSI